MTALAEAPSAPSRSDRTRTNPPPFGSPSPSAPLPSRPGLHDSGPHHDGHPSARSTAARRTAAVALTLVRIPVAAALVVAVAAHIPPLAAALLTAFVAADIADGVWARSRRADTPVRTAIDSIIDRTAVSVTMSVAGATTHNAAVLIAGLTCAAVSVACARTALATWRLRRGVVKAPSSHRLWSLLYAAAGLCWALDLPAAAATCATLAAAAVTVCTVSLSRHHRRMRGRPR